MYAPYMVSWHGILTLYSLLAYPAAGRKPLHVKTGTSLFEAQDLRYCGGTAGEVGASILFSSYDNLPPASNARYLPIVFQTSIRQLHSSHEPRPSGDDVQYLAT